MRRYKVSVVIRVWVDKEIRAKTEEEARTKGKEQAKRLINSDGFSWIDGRVEIAGSTDCSLLDKVPS